MANQTKGPKVAKVTKNGKSKPEKNPPKEKARPIKAKEAAQGEAEVDKKQRKAEKAEQKASANAEKAEKRAAAKAEKEQKKEIAKAERAAKKQSKAEKAKAVKISREGEDEKPAGKKKKLILAAVAIVLVLLIAASVFFLLRMIRGGGKETEASLPDSSSSVAPLVAGTGGGPNASGEDAEPVESAGESSSASEEAPEDKSAQEKSGKGSKKEADPTEKDSKEASSKEESASAEKDKSAPSKDVPSPETAQTLSAETAMQAVEGSAGTASIAATLGSGAVPPDQVDITASTPSDKPKPGQIIGQTGSGADASEPPASSAPEKKREPEKGSTALTPPTETQAVPDFKFSDASLNLPPFSYSTSNALEYAVHRDIGSYLAKKDDRPGTQITSVVIGGTIRQADGSTRVLAYAWGSRYAIADNTLFDYGNLVGPCAMDYQYSGGQYVLQKITLARAGDAFESSVREFCGDRTDVADKMVSQAYDLELRGQMLRNVASYIQQNNIPVIFFRASGQVYNKDGTIYLPPEIQKAEAEEEAMESSSETDTELKEEYRVIQDMPE